METKEPVDAIQRVGTWLFDCRDIMAISDVTVISFEKGMTSNFQFVKIKFTVVMKVPNVILPIIIMVKGSDRDNNYINFRNGLFEYWDGGPGYKSIKKDLEIKSEDYIPKTINRHYQRDFYKEGEHRKTLLNSLPAIDSVINEYNKLCITWEYYKRKM